MLSGKILNAVVGLLLRGIVRNGVRNSGIKAVRSYVAFVQKIRQGALAAAALAVVISLMVMGVFMFITGILWLIPIAGEHIPFLLMAAGLVLALGSFFVLFSVFDQRRWMEMSGSYQLMNLVLGNQNQVELREERVEREPDKGKEAPSAPEPRAEPAMSERDAEMKRRPTRSSESFERAGESEALQRAQMPGHP